MAKEDRISQRLEVGLPAQFCFQEKPEASLKATIVNISTHGFCFRAEAKHNEALNQKPVIRLFIELSEEGRAELDVQVAWSGKTSSYSCLAGGKIMEPSGADYQKILDFYTKVLDQRSK